MDFSERIDTVRAQEPCESRGGRPGLSVLTSLMVSVDVTQYHLNLVPNMSADIPGHYATQQQQHSYHLELN